MLHYLSIHFIKKYHKNVILIFYTYYIIIDMEVI